MLSRLMTFTILFGFLFGETILAQVSRKRRMGDRVYVSNVLENIFGPASKEIIVKNVLNNSSVFGGPCDPYSQYLDPKGSGYEIKGDKNRCFQSFYLEYKAPVLVSANPLRSGAINKVCTKLSQCEECLKFALNKSGVTKGQTLSYNEVIGLYGLFYPFDERAGEKLKSTLKDLELSRKSGPYFLDLFCKSEGWQDL